ncbi:uncharacterized protein [Epargyreus clarus]|uniref:uncharacterized protein n=1 Tax=Epargyreus clarus TaxID=520877 RepID=UPI003C30C613
MKKVIFLCLLSLTLCLSKPSEPDTNSPPLNTKVHDETPPAAPNKIQSNSTQPGTQEKAVTPPIATSTTGPPAHKDETKTNSTLPTQEQTGNSTGKDALPPKENEDKKTETTVTPNNNTTDVKPQTNNETKPEDKKDDKPEDKKVPTTVTPVTPPSAPTESAKTEAPAKADDDKHIVQARGFDGPSFMGGIILTLGLLAIGFMGFKYYKNQTERNYHTL